MTSQEEEMMASLKSSVLNEHRPLLCKILTPSIHFPHLRSKYIIDRDDVEEIESEVTTRRKTDKFIDILVQRGQRGFDELVKSIIKEKTQVFLAEKLNKAFEEKQRRLQAIIAANKSQELDNSESLRLSQGPVEHCNSPEPHPEPPSLKPAYSIPETDSSLRTSLPPQTGFQSHIKSGDLRSSISDLGVDTEKLPKPVMPKSIKSVNDPCKDIDLSLKKEQDGCDENKKYEEIDLNSNEMDSLGKNESKA